MIYGVKDSITNNSVYQQSRDYIIIIWRHRNERHKTNREYNINTNNYNTIEVDGEMLTAAFNDGVPVGTLKSNVYDIQKEVLSTGFPMTIPWFNFSSGGYGFGFNYLYRPS